MEIGRIAVDNRGHKVKFLKKGHLRQVQGIYSELNKTGLFLVGRGTVNNYTRKLHAETGLEMLKEAVLLVLYQKSDEPYARTWLQPEAIREQLDIPKPAKTASDRNALIFGVLDYLHQDGYVFHVEHCGWQITRKGADIIKKEIKDPK